VNTIVLLGLADAVIFEKANWDTLEASKSSLLLEARFGREEDVPLVWQIKYQDKSNEEQKMTN